MELGLAQQEAVPAVVSAGAEGQAGMGIGRAMQGGGSRHEGLGLPRAGLPPPSPDTYRKAALEQGCGALCAPWRSLGRT